MDFRVWLSEENTLKMSFQLGNLGKLSKLSNAGKQQHISSACRDVVWPLHAKAAGKWAGTGWCWPVYGVDGLDHSEDQSSSDWEQKALVYPNNLCSNICACLCIFYYIRYLSCLDWPVFIFSVVPKCVEWMNEWMNEKSVAVSFELSSKD